MFISRAGRESSVDDDNRVVIGMDPHKRSVTIEVMTSDEQIAGGGRFATDVEGFTSMLAYVAAWPDRVWAIEGCEGIGRHPNAALGDRNPGSIRGHRTPAQPRRGRQARPLRGRLLDRNLLGKSVGRRITRLVHRFGFEQLGLHRIDLRVLAFNERAIRSYFDADSPRKAASGRPPTLATNGTTT